MISYTQRRSPRHAEETIWSIEPEALVCRRPDGSTHRVAWSAVTGLRTAYAPTPWRSWRHVMAIRQRGGPTLTFDNCHVVGARRFEDRRASFTPFAQACIAATAAARPQSAAMVGAPPLAYGARLALMMGLWSLALLLAPGGLSGLAMVLKPGLAAAALPVLLLWTAKSRPRRVALDGLALSAGLPS